MAFTREPFPPERRWFLGFVLAIFCCGSGAIVALALDRFDGHAPSLWWAVAVSLVPSLVAGILLARRPPRQTAPGVEQDPLTGLYGEARLRELLEAEWARSKRLSKQVGVVIVDLDQSGRMNVPQYVAWRALARTLKAAVRLYDHSFVLSPGRFAVLLSATSEAGGQAVIERLRKGIREVPELYGVGIRYGKSVLDPSKDTEQAPLKVLADAIEDARSALVESTVPMLIKEVQFQQSLARRDPNKVR